MTYEIQQNRWDQLVRRAGGSIGPGSRVAESLSELFPVLDVERAPGELLALGGTRLAMGAARVGAAVGLFGRTQLFNPADSGILITVSQMWVSVNAIQEVRYALVDTPLATAVNTERYRDTRFGILTGTPVGEIRGETNATATTPTMVWFIRSNDETLIEDPNGVCVLAPGTGLDVGTGNTNSSINTCFNWRERTAEQSELNL